MMKKIGLILLAVLLAAACGSANKTAVKPGVDVLKDNGFDVLKGKRAGLLTNPTGIGQDLKSTIDILWEAEDVNLVALYGPEHGVRGDYAAGDYVDTYTDEQTGLTVYSLYGRNRKPTAEMLEGIDVLVYDIQDIGCRSYTYISSLGEIMEAAAENDIEVVVLDRPNPLTGNKIEGNIVRDGFYSFVSAFPIPYVYGLTPGEVAKMINGEGWLENGAQCKLTVVPMKGWKRSMSFEDTGLPWVPSSPHIPHAYSAAYYVATGVLGELGVVSEGVGYTLPFQVYAAEWIDNPFKLAENMNALGLDGVRFRPIVFKPYYHKHQGKTLRGVQIHIDDFEKSELMYLQFRFLEVLHGMYPEKDVMNMNPVRHRMFDKVCGTDEIRTTFAKNYKFEDIRPILERDLDDFRTLSQKYYLYR